MLDITENPRVLEKEDGNLSIQEFIVGHRLDIKVAEDGVFLSQDEDYNEKTFGNILNLDTFWDKIESNFKIDSERLIYAPIQFYTLKCIFYDPDLMKNKKTVYPNKGLIVVEIHPENATSMITSSRIPEFCTRIGMAGLEPLFVGTVDLFRQKMLELRQTSNFASNRLGAGLVIKNEPAQFDAMELNFKRWFIQPDHSIALSGISESPEALANEFVNYIYSPDAFVNFEESIHIDPLKNKVKFRNAMLTYLKNEYKDMYNDFIDRSKFLLGEINANEKFDAILKNEIKTIFTRYTSELNVYKNRG